MNKIQARKCKTASRKVLEHANTLVSEMKSMQEHYDLQDMTVVSALSIFEGIIQDCTDIITVVNELVTDIDNNEEAPSLDV